MRYRAILTGDPDAERANQRFGESLGELREWAQKALKTAPEGAEVVIYETTETVVGVVLKEKTEAKP